MRIFLSSQQALRRHAVPAYGFWTYYFKHGLAEAGHEVLEAPDVDWAEGLVSLDAAARRRWLTDTWNRTVEFIRAEHARRPIDFFLGYLFPNQVDSSAVASIRQLGVPCVNFFCDNVREFTTVPASYRAFDLHWVPEADARAMYREARLPFLYAPMPMWVPPALRSLPETETTDVTFVGSHDLLREDLLGEAVGRGMPLRLHGAGWRPAAGAAASPLPPSRRQWQTTLGNQVSFWRAEGLKGFLMRATYQLRRRQDPAWVDRCWQPSPDDAGYFKVLRESAVVIGINRYPSFRHTFNHPGRYSRLRDLEAPMLGACYLTEEAPGLEDLYDLTSEIATFRDAVDLVAQCERLQADPARRLALRRAGQRRALSEHTVPRSIQRIAEKIGHPA